MKTKQRRRAIRRGRPAKPLPKIGRHYTPAANLARIIRDSRLAMGRKAFAVADEAGISLSRYYEIESADFVNPPDLAALLRIAALLKIEEMAINKAFLELSRNV